MKYTITLIPGDGIGPEVTDAARRCIDATGVDIRWEEAIAGQNALDKYGELLPNQVLDSVKKNKIALKGPIITPVGDGFRSVNVAIRQALDLYACVRPARSYRGINSRYDNLDLLIIRENSEDLYAGIEFEGNQRFDFSNQKKRQETNPGRFRDIDKTDLKIRLATYRQVCL